MSEENSSISQPLETYFTKLKTAEEMDSMNKPLLCNTLNGLQVMQEMGKTDPQVFEDLRNAIPSIDSMSTTLLAAKIAELIPMKPIQVKQLLPRRISMEDSDVEQIFT